MGGAFALEVLAWLAADAGRCERAAWLLGAAHSLWERAGTRLGNNAIMEEFHQRAVAEAAVRWAPRATTRCTPRGRRSRLT